MATDSDQRRGLGRLFFDMYGDPTAVSVILGVCGLATLVFFALPMLVWFTRATTIAAEYARWACYWVPEDCR